MKLFSTLDIYFDQMNSVILNRDRRYRNAIH